MQLSEKYNRASERHEFFSIKRGTLWILFTNIDGVLINVLGLDAVVVLVTYSTASIVLLTYLVARIEAFHNFSSLR